MITVYGDVPTAVHIVVAIDVAVVVVVTVRVLQTVQVQIRKVVYNAVDVMVGGGVGESGAATATATTR